jgi:lipoprotein-anchoring transpeptidase ErfK/SrfK
MLTTRIEFPIQGQVASTFFKGVPLRVPGTGADPGRGMGKRSKRRTTQALAAPIAVKVSAVGVAFAALGWYLLSPPAIVHPVRVSSVRPVQPPAAAPARIPVPAPRPAAATAAPVPAPQLDLPKTAVSPGRFSRQVVDYASREAPGTVVVDTENTFLYFVLNGGEAIRYGIGVGREGFTWSGEQSVTRKTEWPDWRPPSEMLSRQPYLPRFMAGGPGNPLGARAMYLGETEYRIHGTNNPHTIGQRVSSGCIRLTNEDIADLYARVKIGAKVIVLPATRPDLG